MKKAITILMAVALVFGLAGMAAAQGECITCIDDLLIDRGCETEQDQCEPYDYENNSFLPNYCQEPAGKADPRVLFPICDCDFATDLEAGDVVDVRLEILVNGKTGDNGAYWAEDVNLSGIGMETYSSETAACEDTNFGSAFIGNFVYYGFDEDGDRVVRGPAPTANNCDLDDSDRSTIIEPQLGQTGQGTHGYVIQDADEVSGNSTWAINIPYILFDPTMINEGDVISVQICLSMADRDNNYEVEIGGICVACECCCEFELGTILCCQAGASTNLVYPYVTPMNDANWWYGMVITNLSSTDGEAAVTIYETDGDTETVTVPVEANNMFVASNVDLMDAFGEGIGDARAYFTVRTDFNADGFLFIGNDGKSEAMGYLPRN